MNTNPPMPQPSDLSVNPLCEKVWFNGEIVNFADAKVDMSAHALHYGGGVFEGIRAYSGKAFALQAHTERLIRSSQLIGLHVTYSIQELIDATKAVLKANNLTEDSYIRPLIFRGNTDSLRLGSFSRASHVWIGAWSWPNPFRQNGGGGLHVEVSHWRRYDPKSFPTESKCAAMYVVGTMAQDWARAQGANDALLLDYMGNIAELSGANVMFVKDGTIHTPIPNSFLDGITRKTVISLAEKRNITVAQRLITVDELPSFSEAFIVGTAAEITPISRIGTTNYNVGGMAESLRETYLKHVHE